MEKVRFVAAVLPPHDVRRRSVGASHLEHFSIAVRLARLVPMDDDPITYVGLHSALPIPTPHIHDLPRLLPVRQSQRSYVGVGARVTGWQRVGARRLELPDSATRVVAREPPWLGPLALPSAFAVVVLSLRRRSVWTWMLRLPSRNCPAQTELSPRLCVAESAVVGALTDLGDSAWIAESYKEARSFV
jgi:hypothetical protein